MSKVFPQEQTKIDTTANYIYIGKAACGASVALPACAIKRITLVDGLATEIKRADGDSDVDNIWNDRASLVYS